MEEIINIPPEESIRALRTLAESVNKERIEKLFLYRDITEMLISNITYLGKIKREKLIKEIYPDKEAEETENRLKKIDSKIGKILAIQEQISRLKEKKEQYDPTNPFYKKYERESEKFMGKYMKTICNLLVQLIQRTNLRNQTLKDNWFIGDKQNVQRAYPYQYLEYNRNREENTEEKDENY